MAHQDDEIKKTYIDSTKAQRRHWTHLMLTEKKRTNDTSLNLSTWIIRQLPQPVAEDGITMSDDRKQ